MFSKKWLFLVSTMKYLYSSLLLHIYYYLMGYSFILLFFGNTRESYIYILLFHGTFILLFFGNTDRRYQATLEASHTITLATIQHVRKVSTILQTLGKCNLIFFISLFLNNLLLLNILFIGTDFLLWNNKYFFFMFNIFRKYNVIARILSKKYSSWISIESSKAVETTCHISKNGTLLHLMYVVLFQSFVFSSLQFSTIQIYLYTCQYLTYIYQLSSWNTLVSFFLIWSLLYHWTIQIIYIHVQILHIYINYLHGILFSCSFVFFFDLIPSRDPFWSNYIFFIFFFFCSYLQRRTCCHEWSLFSNMLSTFLQTTWSKWRTLSVRKSSR